MNQEKRKRLEAEGFEFGTVAEFLGLSEEESEMIELRLTLATQLRQQRLAHNLSQVALAKRLGSSQSRIAKMEAADASVSIDLLCRAYFALGIKHTELGCLIASQTDS